MALKLWFGLQRDIEDFELWFFPQRRRTLQVIFSAIVTLVCVLCFVAIALTQFEVEAYLEESGASKSTAFLIKGVVGGVLIPIVNSLYDTLANKLTDAEHYPTVAEHDNSLALKKFTFEFVSHSPA